MRPGGRYAASWLLQTPRTLPNATAPGDVVTGPAHARRERTYVRMGGRGAGAGVYVRRAFVEGL